MDKSSSRGRSKQVGNGAELAQLVVAVASYSVNVRIKGKLLIQCDSQDLY